MIIDFENLNFLVENSLENEWPLGNIQEIVHHVDHMQMVIQKLLSLTVLVI